MAEVRAHPTAKDRVERARAALQDRLTLVPSSTSATTGQFDYLVNRERAHELLQRGFLHTKPEKKNPLLSHALTNVNGDDWKRQRPLLLKALNNRDARKVAAETACRVVLQEVAKVESLDVRRLALTVAANTMAVTVFAATDSQAIAEPLMALYQPTLLSGFTNPEQLEVLSKAADHILDQMRPHPDTHTSSLANSLLALEGKLSRQEIRSNCFSALFAGTQTIATTLAGALLHLSGSCEDVASTCSTKAVCHETLRILPPVASQPRILDLPHCDYGAIDSPSASPSPSKRTILIDLLAFAHAGVACEREEKEGSDGSTWKFCAVHNQPPSPDTTTQKSTKTPAAVPWGIGKRSCPAGSLSVDAISSALEALIMAKYRWTFQNKQDENWINAVSYAPTLMYPFPIQLVFSQIS